MIDSIYIAMTGLSGYQKGLQVISNDSANLNTPGFKGSRLQFSDMFYSGNASGGNQGAGQYGSGLNTLGTVIDFKQGQFQNTGNELDLALDGTGFFVLKDTDGNMHYTRDGQFKFDKDKILVSSVTGEQVMALDSGNKFVPISIATSNSNPAKATTTVSFRNNLLSTPQQTVQTVSNVTVIDNAGTSHTLSANLTQDSNAPGSWKVDLMDGTTTVGSGTIAFIQGQPDPANSKVNVTYTPTGQPAQNLTLVFSNVTSYSSGNAILFESQDGYALGELSSTSFDDTGTLILTYSNAQTTKGARLALRRSNVQDAIKSIGDNEYAATDESAWSTGVAGEQGFANVKSKSIEMSNVDLSQEFSNLVIMQRGYQASSQVVSTANEMLSDLFAMKGK